MFGLEKKGEAPFEFELETEMRANPAKLKQTLKDIEGKIQEIKNSLRQGSSSAEFDKLGVLLHGYAAMQKVLNRINKR